MAIFPNAGRPLAGPAGARGGPALGSAPRPHRPQRPRPRRPGSGDPAPDAPRELAPGWGERGCPGFAGGSRRGPRAADRPAPPRDCRALWGRARLHPETAWPVPGPRPKSGCVAAARTRCGALRAPRLRSEVGCEGCFRSRCQARGRVGGGSRRPPLRHSGPAAWGPAGVRDRAPRPAGRLRPLRPLRRGRGRPAQGPWPGAAQTESGVART